MVGLHQTLRATFEDKSSYDVVISAISVMSHTETRSDYLTTVETHVKNC